MKRISGKALDKLKSPLLVCTHGRGSIMARSARSWAAHVRSTQGELRPSAYRRGYDKRWAETSRRFKEANPLCVDCLAAGRVTASAEVHHVRKLSDRPDRKHDWTNLMALCSSCHAIRTGRGE